jgi:hypothetical protein
MEAAFQIAVRAESHEMDWSIFFNQALLNVSFFVSDFVVIHGVMDILKETDVDEAHKKLLNPLAAIANDISEVTFGFAKLMFQRYINNKELLMTVVAKIADAPDIGDLRLPFYVETPGLRNT